MQALASNAIVHLSFGLNLQSIKPMINYSNEGIPSVFTLQVTRAILA